jgi:uncharacterized membrane protein
MSQILGAALLVAVLFSGIIICLEAGWRAGRRRPVAGQGAVEAAVFGLMGLLMAFTFSGAAARFDSKRELVIQEANAIGTAYLRLDLLPPAAQPPLRDLFRRYVDARLSFYRNILDSELSRRDEAIWVALQGEIWTGAVTATREETALSARFFLLPALNDMIDITTTRAAARRMHPDAAIFAMLGVAVLAGALLAGWGMAASSERSLLHVVAFALLMTIAVYVILDLEYPRIGFLRIDSFDSFLVEVRRSMK